ncbi:MAG TPA: hypothetical protein VF158_12710 [Longimicrobiales bacterium]
MNGFRIRLGPRAQAATLLALVGTLGILLGIGLDRVLVGPAPAGIEARPAHAIESRRSPGPPPRGRLAAKRLPDARFGDRIAEALELAPHQKAAIDSILAESQERVRALAGEYRPRFRAIVEATWRDVDAVLTAEQRARLRAWRAEGRRRGGDGSP